MKKIFFLLFFTISICQSALGQKSFFGVNAGVDVANQRQYINYGSGFNPSTQSSFFKNIAEPAFGVFYQYGFNEKIGLRLNPQFIGLGYTRPNQNLLYINGRPYDNLSIYYFYIPLTVHYSLNEHFSFNAGPYLSFTYGGTKINGEPITNIYHKNDYGFSFGGEHDLYKNLAISINYIFGLKNIWLNDNYYQGFGVKENKITNRALQLALIYKFKKSKD